MKKQPRRNWVLILVGIAALILTVALISANGYISPLYTLIRACGILGYLAVFLSCLSSVFLRELTRYFGRPFVQIHHVAARSGLILLLAHAAAVAWDESSLAAFAPRFDSLTRFLELGGRPALWLIIVAVLAAVLRSRLRRSWRPIHWLNYAAFLLATAHGTMIGTDLAHPIVRVIAAGMAASLVLVFVWKRVQQRPRGARSKTDQRS